MIVGIGIDTVCISELEELRSNDDGVFDQYMFTEAERLFAAQRGNPTQTLAGMLAVKEAVTKAVCTLRPQEWIEMRLIEVEHDVHGAPHVADSSPLKEYLQAAGVTGVLVSITNEGDFATAIALAQNDE